MVLDKRGQVSPGLYGLAGRANKITEYGNVWAIGADAAGVHGQAEALGKLKIHTGIVEFRKAETRRGQHAIETRRINGARRTMALPGTARKFVELLPVAFVPRIHLNPWTQCPL